MTSATTLRRLFSSEHGLPNHLLARWLFLRALGLIYLSAFFSLVFQIHGLIGPAGILPAADYLHTVAQSLGPLARLWYAPTLLWISSTNPALTALCWVGMLASVLVVLNLWPRASLLLCFACFLSFVSAAGDFSSYQSDVKIHEDGFLYHFLAPRGLRPRLGAHSLPSRAAYFLLLWEWFRIYFQSGIVKLLSGDPTWRNLTAMYEYYQNGPLPTWIGWYLQQLPHWFHIATAALTLFMELVLVFMAFLPRPWRIACFVLVTTWQTVVILTANYAFLNYLVLILAILLLDDTLLRRLIPARWRPQILPTQAAASETSVVIPTEGTAPNPVIPTEGEAAVEGPASLPLNSTAEPASLPLCSTPEHTSQPTALHNHLAAIRLAITTLALTLIAYCTAVQLIDMFWPNSPLRTKPLVALEPFRIANQYGLFAVMTPHRYEIEFQGSNDGTNWTAYPFLYKPQNPTDRPRIYAPYQPRFDWNLWFASLGSWTDYPIVPRTEELLLTDDRDVLGLFAANPFPSAPPRYIRAVLWQYWFSTPAEKDLKDIWWTRQLLGTYAPTLTRTPNGRFAITEPPTLTGPAQ